MARELTEAEVRALRCVYPEYEWVERCYRISERKLQEKRDER